MRAIFEKYLRQAKEKNKLVAIRTNVNDADKFSVGYILGLNDDTISIKAISPQGLPDGIFTIQTDDMYGIDLDDEYTRRLEAKEKNNKKIFADIPAPSFFSDADLNIGKVITKAKDAKQMIHINFYRDMGLYGFINELSDEEFVIEVYNDYGDYDGTSVYLIEDIKNINWDDEDIRLINLLRKGKNTGPNKR
jgi:hypothetical protein